MQVDQDPQSWFFLIRNQAVGIVILQSVGNRHSCAAVELVGGKVISLACTSQPLTCSLLSGASLECAISLVGYWRMAYLSGS